MRGFDGERRCIGDLVGSDAGERAARDVAGHIAARAFRAEADGAEGLHDFGDGFYGEPVELNILADGKIGERVAVTLGDLRDGPQLIGSQQAIGKGDTHHEILCGFALASRATDGASAVTLRINAPTVEIEVRPFGEYGGAAQSREFFDFVKVLPRILGALEALDLLSLCFFRLLSSRNVCCAGHYGLRVCRSQNAAQKQKTRYQLRFAGERVAKIRFVAKLNHSDCTHPCQPWL